MKHHGRRITRLAWYRAGGLSNPQLYRRHNRRFWMYYER